MKFLKNFKNQKYKTLAIETSCDDTSVAIVARDGQGFVTENILAYSQIADHQKYGGVVPEVAYRIHSDKIISIIEHIGLDEVASCDVISVTSHPGLPGSLLVGMTTAHSIGLHYDIPVYETNHIYGHIWSNLIDRSIDEFGLPMVILTASGGHNEIYLVSENDIGSDIYTGFKWCDVYMYKLGFTLDDAAGEVFDKVSRMLGGPYPGGPWIGKQASISNKNPEYKFKRIYLDGDSNKYNFSFSGSKSQVNNLIRKLESDNIQLDDKIIADISYEFQESVVEVLGNKLISATNNMGAKYIAIVGGVSANDRLYQYVSDQILGTDYQLYRPIKKVYSMDNGAMIGVVGLMEYMYDIYSRDL